MKIFQKVYDLFIDIERSKQFLKDYEKEFMFTEVDDDFHKHEKIRGNNMDVDN